MLDQYLNQAIEVEDPSAPDQCMDWAFKVCDLRGIPRAAIRNAAAKDVWTNHNTTLLAEYADPQPLDFAIWGTAVGQYGHIAVVKSGTRSAFQSYDQNWNGIQKVKLVDHNAYGLLGFLRFTGGSNVAASQDIVDQTVIQLAYNGILFRDASPAEIQPRIAAKQTVEALMRELIASGEHNTLQYDNEIGKRAVSEGWSKPGSPESVEINGVAYVPKS